MPFKQFFGLMMSVLLLVSNSGLAFNVHYCDDEIASVSLRAIPDLPQIQNVDECCGVVEKDSQCCQDKVIKAENKSDQIVVKTFDFETGFVAIADFPLTPVFASACHFRPQDRIAYHCDAHAPPLYLLYSQYTLYA